MMARASRWRARAWIEAAALAAVALAGAALLATVHPQRDAVRVAAEVEREITVAEASALVPAPVWVDVRPRGEGATPAAGEALPPGVLPLPEAEFEARIGAVLEAWDGAACIIVADTDGRSGSARVTAARLRREFGIEPVRILHGGWHAWSQPAR